MIFVLLIVTCIILVEFIHIINFVYRLNVILKLTKKVFTVLFSIRISDHWKERIIPNYAWKLMKLTFQIFLIIFLIISVFFIMDKYVDGFLSITLSLPGIFMSSLFIIAYSWLRKILKNE